MSFNVTTQELVKAMQIRAFHNKNHDVSMEQCIPVCQAANKTIETDHKSK